ncbi:Glucose-methanol-choline oxidoreductase, N-terminal [Sesbania bispinosa]|nr:Glucose-methanol-choline oxidoreductase, N-terminal [Sesbania bispinosa]
MGGAIGIGLECLAWLIFYTTIFASRCAAQRQEYLKMVANATDFPLEDYYDYIIVGGGTAGCPLAATLSQGFRVLLLERGGIAHGKPNLMNQEGFLTTLLNANANELDSPAQPFISEEGVPNARGRVLGGSSAINAGFYSRADPDFFTRDHGEVILSAGAIGSPQLLLLSGIGPRPYLSSWGIPVAHHLPYVGHFLYDNPRNGITILPSLPLEHSLIQVVGITDSGAYIEAASNVVPFVSPPQSVFIRTPSSPLYLTVATLISKISGPVSSGFLRLASTDVRFNPIVRFNYFNNPVDVERCVNGTRKIGDVLRSRALNDFKFRNWLGGREFRFIGPALPMDQTDYLQMADFCRRTVSTIWHYHGGCVVGRVVDPHLKVIGIDSLRIVDGSVFSVSPGTNPQATLMMLGRYFGLKIIRERERHK